MMIFENICQIVRKRCQMLKQMRKKALLYEKFLILGICPKNMEKWQFFGLICAHRILILLNFGQKSLSCYPPLGIWKNIHPCIDDIELWQSDTERSVAWCSILILPTAGIEANFRARFGGGGGRARGEGMAENFSE